MREEVEAQHKGIDNAFRLAVLSGGMEWKPMSFSAAEAELIDTRRAAQDEVCIAYDVKRSVIAEHTGAGTAPRRRRRSSATSTARCARTPASPSRSSSASSSTPSPNGPTSEAVRPLRPQRPAPRHLPRGGRDRVYGYTNGVFSEDEARERLDYSRLDTEESRTPHVPHAQLPRGVRRPDAAAEHRDRPFPRLAPPHPPAHRRLTSRRRGVKPSRRPTSCSSSAIRSPACTSTARPAAGRRRPGIRDGQAAAAAPDRRPGGGQATVAAARDPVGAVAAPAGTRRPSPTTVSARSTSSAGRRARARPAAPADRPSASARAFPSSTARAQLQDAAARAEAAERERDQRARGEVAPGPHPRRLGPLGRQRRRLPRRRGRRRAHQPRRDQDRGGAKREVEALAERAGHLVRPYGPRRPAGSGADLLQQRPRPRPASRQGEGDKSDEKAVIPPDQFNALKTDQLVALQESDPDLYRRSLAPPRRQVERRAPPRASS
jgi:hypothetical protein